MTQKVPSLTDKHVASRIRLRRLQLGMSQEGLAHALNVTFQQVQKYEKGANRVSAGRLQEIATALSVAPQFFYEGCSEPSEAEENQEASKLAQLMVSPEVVSLIQAVGSFRSPRIRQLMSELAVAIAEEINGEGPSSGSVVIRRSSRGR